MKAVAKQFNCDQVRQLARLTGPTGNYSEAEFGCITLSDPLLMCVMERLSPLGKETAFSTVPVKKLVATVLKLRTLCA